MNYKLNRLQSQKSDTNRCRNALTVSSCFILALAFLSMLASCSTFKPSTSLVESVHQFNLEGKVAILGFVKDSENGKPIFGASVIFDGTTGGAATDEQGSYTIPNIPSGKYTVKVAMVGYADCTSAELILTSNSIVVLDFSLSPQEVKTVAIY